MNERLEAALEWCEEKRKEREKAEINKLMDELSQAINDKKFDEAKILADKIYNITEGRGWGSSDFL